MCSNPCLFLFSTGRYSSSSSTIIGLYFFISLSSTATHQAIIITLAVPKESVGLELMGATKRARMEATKG